MHRSCRRSRGGHAPGQPSASGGDVLGVVAGLVDRRDKRRIVETIAMDRYELRLEVDVDGLDAADRCDLTCHRIPAVAAVHAGNRVSLGLHRASFCTNEYTRQGYFLHASASGDTFFAVRKRLARRNSLPSR